MLLPGAKKHKTVLGLVTKREKYMKGISYSTADEVLEIVKQVSYTESSLGTSGQ